MEVIVRLRASSNNSGVFARSCSDQSSIVLSRSNRGFQSCASLRAWHGFSRVLQPRALQCDVFDEALHLRQSCDQMLQGRSLCLFSYGSRLTGRSYTLFGAEYAASGVKRGILSRMVEQLTMRICKTKSNPNRHTNDPSSIAGKWTLEMSVVAVSNSLTVIDVLSCERAKCRVLSSGMVAGDTRICIDSIHDLHEILQCCRQFNNHSNRPDQQRAFLVASLFVKYGSALISVANFVDLPQHRPHLTGWIATTFLAVQQLAASLRHQHHNAKKSDKLSNQMPPILSVLQTLLRQSMGKGGCEARTICIVHIHCSNYDYTRYMDAVHSLDYAASLLPETGTMPWERDDYHAQRPEIVESDSRLAFHKARYGELVDGRCDLGGVLRERAHLKRRIQIQDQLLSRLRSDEYIRQNKVNVDSEAEKLMILQHQLQVASERIQAIAESLQQSRKSERQPIYRIMKCVN